MNNMISSAIGNYTHAVFLTAYGKVQGVGFRRKFCKDANRNQLQGWICNMPNGSVDIILQGPKESVIQAILKILSNTYGTSVTSLILNEINTINIDGFRIASGEPFLHKVEVQKERISILNNEFSKIGWMMKRWKRLGIRASQLHDLLLALPKRYWPQYMNRFPNTFKTKFRLFSCSFATEIWSKYTYVEGFKATSIPPESAFNDKVKGREFAIKCGLLVSKLFAKDLPIADIRFDDGIVIKPKNAAGARGVYLVYSSDKIFEIRNKKWLYSLKDTQNAMKKYLRRYKERDSWIIEEFIRSPDGSPANDLKFYCFYGRIPLILEVARTDLGPKYCWWRADGVSVVTGKYENEKLYSTHFEQKHIDIVAAISLKIPTPFIRIDFLKAGPSLYFGEFTPFPGSFDRFNAETDAILGREFALASGRLMADLLSGKQFHEYKDFISRFNL